MPAAFQRYSPSIYPDLSNSSRKHDIDELFRVGSLGRRYAVAHVFEDGLEAFQVGIGFGFYSFAQRLIGVFELLFVFGLAVFERTLVWSLRDWF